MTQALVFLDRVHVGTNLRAVWQIAYVLWLRNSTSKNLPHRNTVESKRHMCEAEHFWKQSLLTEGREICLFHTHSGTLHSHKKAWGRLCTPVEKYKWDVKGKKQVATQYV